MNSTAAAAAALLTEFPRGAAICSQVCSTVFDGLEVLQTSIQDKSGSYIPQFYELSDSFQRQLYPVLCGEQG